ncbi:MAG: RNA polymerase sigma factor [Ignavibacteria bacterium]
MPIDSAKFTILLKPHYNDALKYSRALCSSWSADNAEDVLQQSFLLALENFSGLKDESKFRSWFFKIITTTFYSSIRKHFWKKFLPMDEAKSVTDNLPDVYDRAEQSENRMMLNRALSRLSKKERSAVLLFEIADFSIEEIKKIQSEKSLSAVKSRLSRARIKLKKYITEQENFLGRNCNTYGDFNGDLENETLSLISEIRTER